MAIVGALPFTIVNGTPNDAVPLMTDLQFIVSSVNASAAGLGQANNFTNVSQTINSDTIVTATAVQTLTNKVLTAPTLTSAPAPGDNSLKVPTTSWVVSIGLSSALPGQSAATAGLVPISNGTTAAWGNEIQINSVAKVANYVAVNGDQFPQDTSGGAFQVTLPTGLTGYAPILIHDLKGTFGTNNLTITTVGGQLVMGAAGPMLADVNNFSAWLVYTGASQGWRFL